MPTPNLPHRRCSGGHRTTPPRGVFTAADAVTRVLYRSGAAVLEVPDGYQAVAVGNITDAPLAAGDDDLPALVHPFDVDTTPGTVVWVYLPDDDLDRLTSAPYNAQAFFLALVSAELEIHAGPPWRLFRIAPTAGAVLRALAAEGVDR
jgi:hypothetical protein